MIDITYLMGFMGLSDSVNYIMQRQLYLRFVSVHRQQRLIVSPKSTQCSRLCTESREQDEVPYFIQFVSRISKGAGVRLSHIGKGFQFRIPLSRVPMSSLPVRTSSGALHRRFFPSFFFLRHVELQRRRFASRHGKRMQTLRHCVACRRQLA